MRLLLLLTIYLCANINTVADVFRARRVHTGFEWNKYNQTHYDMDNPPPKIVQGYKFNIFYPDLIDKTKTPEYTLVSGQNFSGMNCNMLPLEYFFSVLVTYSLFSNSL